MSTESFRNIFDHEWQKQFISILFYSRDVASRALPVIDADYFENPLDKEIVRALLRFFDKYHGLPTLADIRSMVKIDVQNGEIDEEVLDEILLKLDEYYSLEIDESSISSTADNFINFVRQQAMKRAILRSADLITGQPIWQCEEAIRGEFDEVALIGRHKDDVGTYFSEMGNYLRQAMVEPPVKKCPTGRFTRIDQSVGGGFDAGCLYSIMAPPKFGKSTTLINLGSSLAWNGAFVLHISLEMSKHKVLKKYSEMLIGGEYVEDYTNIEDIEHKIQVFNDISDGEILVQSFPTRTLTVSGLRAYLMQLDVQGIKPDVVIVDYADIMRLPGQFKRYEELSNLYADMRGLGQEINAVILTATQSNRVGAVKYKPNIEDIAGSFEKVAEVDGLLALCRTEKERKHKLSRLYAIATRDAEYLNAIWLHTDFERCWMKEIDEDMVPDEFLRREHGDDEE